MKRIQVPRIIEDKSLLNFFSGWQWIIHPGDDVSLDFCGVEHISPYAITLFAAYILWLEQVEGVSVSVSADFESVAGRYLRRAGFFQVIGAMDDGAADDGDERTAKLTEIRSSKEIPAFSGRIMDLLRIENEDIAGALKYSLVELLRNVVQHSSSRIGGVAMAQYFPRSGLVNLCVADMGVGIRRTLSVAYPEIDDDLKAIKFATQPHISGTFGPSMYNEMKDNAGLGLFFIKQITSLSEGSFFLASGDAISDIWADGEGQKKIHRTAKQHGWPGTFAYLQLRRDSIGAFEDILQSCRHWAAQARQYPQDLALDFIEGVIDMDEIVLVRVVDFEEDVERAAEIRDCLIIPSMAAGKMVIIDFAKVGFATQSFVHALMYKVIRDGAHIAALLSLANCTASTRESVMAVAAYARSEKAVAGK